MLKEALAVIPKAENNQSLSAVFLEYFGQNGKFTHLSKQLIEIPNDQKPKVGRLLNEVKFKINTVIENRKKELTGKKLEEELDVTSPGIRPEKGSLHIVTQAIAEITAIFEKIGFSRLQYPEVEWEWYAFESLNMPKNHPARDDFETFFVDFPPSEKFGRMVLSPHTSSGQVREMERLKGLPPIRMINIAKCYRPNWDVSHTPMFHQFEGLVVDRDINITHLKGTMDYFARSFFGKDRVTRLRPFHFQFTEPSFEVDINCGICLGTGKLKSGISCRLCKSGWLELGGSGMVHPNVLKAGKIDPEVFSGFAFGWGIERTYMMKSGTRLDDIRILYQNDLRFLNQF